MQEEIRKQLQESLSVLNAFLDNEYNILAIESAAKIMIDCINSGRKIIACGNGGSMSDAMHFASELTGRYKLSRRSLPAVAISDPGHISCVANDYGYEHVFAKYIQSHGKPVDVLLALSTSGNSKNVVYASKEARKIGMDVISITGSVKPPTKKIAGALMIGKESELYINSNVNISIPHHGSADKIQEITIMIIHALVEQIEKGVKL